MPSQINNTISTVFKATQDMINGMPANDRRPVKETVSEIAAETGISLAITNGLVALYTEQQGRDVSKRAGRAGGIIKQDIETASTIEPCDHCGAPMIISPEQNIINN